MVSHLFIILNLSTCTFSHFVFSTSGLSIEFMGMTYANNTAIAITEVGEDDNAVLCRTDLTPCCNGTSDGTRKGNWRYPDGTLVNNNGNIYRDRRNMVVRLHRRNSPITPTGQYCCEVPTMAERDASKICIQLGKILKYNGSPPTPTGARHSGCHRNEIIN